MKIVIGIIVIVILGWLIFGTGLLDGTPATDTQNEEGSMEEDNGITSAMPAIEHRTLDITGKNFAFSQKEISVNKGDTVTINFEATEGLHDFVVDEFSAATKQVQPGTKTSVTFVADKAGEFEYYCSVGSHRAMGMTGKLIVTEVKEMIDDYEVDGMMEE